ncbi:MAG: NfeD family protein [Treponema sp.]|nr:NfeD family protein [Treponema sp.]
MYLLFDFGGLSPHWIWLGLTIIFAIIEAITFGLTTIWLALGAFVLIFISFLPIPFEFQILIFLAISAVLLFFTRPLALKKFKTGNVKTNVDSFVGKTALVVKQITEFDRGEVKVSGQIWSARLEDGSSLTLTEGTKCEIVRIEGVQAIVCPLNTIENNQRGDL